MAPSPQVPAPSSVLSAEGARAASWYRLVALPGTETLLMRPVEPGAGPLGLSRDLQLALALPLSTEAAAAEALAVSVVLRAPHGPASDGLPWAVLVELPAALDPARGLSVAEFAGLTDPTRIGTHVLEAAPADEPGLLRLTADCVVERMAPELALLIMSPAQTAPGEVARLESVEIGRRSLAEHVAQGRPYPRLVREPGREAVRLTLDRDCRQALLALPGRRYAFALPRDERPRRLDLALGVAPRAATRDGSIRLVVSADGATLLEKLIVAPLDAGDPAWTDVSLPLPDGASELVLSAEGVGADPPLAAFGHPTVRAASRAGAASAGAGGNGAPAGASPRPNVVLISLDTLRPDRLGCYGAQPSHSPRLDALARESLRFTDAYSTSSYTLPAHGSMLTGQYPAVHGATAPEDRLDPARSPFLAQMLADAGYVTAGFTGGAYMAADFGFAHGFDRYANNDPVWALDSLRGRQLMEMGTGQNAGQHAELLRRYATPAIARWIEAQDDGVPFFLFVHTYVVHNYAPDRARLRKHGLLGEKGSETRLDDSQRERFNFGETALHDEVLASLLPYYDATIEMADDLVGALLDALDSAGLAGRTLVIVTSDHGEEFGEHGYFGHGKNVYESNVRVPLLVRRPGGEPGVVEDLVTLADLPPLILREAGLAPDPRMSLGAEWDPARVLPPARPRVVIELDTRFERVSAIREGPLKLSVRTVPTRFAEPANGPAAAPAELRVELFDVAQDGAERAELSAGAPDRVAKLRAQLEAYRTLTAAIRAAVGGDGADTTELDPRTREQLIQMGYIEDDREGGGERKEERDDGHH